MHELEPLLAYWRAQDALFERVEPTTWGAVVSDRRFPAVRDANYARVDAPRRVRLADVELHLLPALRRSGARSVHAVLFHPDDQTALIADASSRGERITWDLVMSAAPSARGGIDGGEEVSAFDDAFWSTFRDVARLFGVADDAELEQLTAIERELMLPAGRRWFAVRERGRPIALAALLVLERVGYLDHVVTLPPARRRGIAHALTRRALAEAWSVGARHVVLLAEPDGAAVRIYERCGFGRAGHLASWISPLDP